MEIRRVEVSDITLIEPLWQKLNSLHLNDSVHFKDHFENFTFQERCRGLISRVSEKIRIDVLFKGSEPAGYCISVVNGKAGEIESLFIEEELRGRGHGEELVNLALTWLNKAGCEKIEISVAGGHESVFGFYKKFGFHPRMTVLRQVIETRNCRNY
ncbi:MAG: GNAT family N-acetyltransferase [Spirochaetales bacterium]|nr:GNAT family N-acetyltransferase [Spirochaetales bacterium]